MPQFHYVFALNDKGLPAGPWATRPDVPYVPAEGECYGLPTGDRNGVWVLDLDRKGGKDGVKALMAHIIEYDLPQLPDTYAVQTKSGGIHLYYALPEDGIVIRNRTGVLEGVDVRGEGGFVRAGGPQYPVLEDVEPVLAPPWLVALVTRQDVEAVPVSAIAITQDSPEWDHRHHLAEQLLANANPCIEGQGGDAQLWVIACHLTRTFELPIDSCLALLEPFNARCVPPWSEKDLARKLHEAATKGTSLPGTFPRGFCAPVERLIPAPKPMVMAGPVSTWRRKRGQPNTYKFEMAQDIAGNNKESPMSQRELTASLTGPGASPDWTGVWQYDLFTNRLIAINPPLRLDAEDKGLTSGDLANIKMWYSVAGFKVTVPMLEEAIKTAAMAAPTHFVREYLQDLPPVTTGHLKNAGTSENVFGSKRADAPHVTDFLRKWMIGCVARVMRPGSQFDTVLTLLGQGGYRKSSFFKALAVESDWYRGNAPAISDPQKVGLAMRGHWIVELGELTTMRQSQRDMFLEFISRTEEKFRAPYEKCEVTEKRQCGIGATANPAEFISSLDGAIARRFLPIMVTKKIDTDWVADHRDELWAEAFEAWSQGEKWWVEDETVLDAFKDAFKDQSPIEEKLDTFLSGPLRTTLNGKSAGEIWEAVFCDPQRPSLPTTAQRQEIGRCMKSAPGVKCARRNNVRCYEVTALIDGRPMTDAELAEATAKKSAAGFFGA